MIVIVILCTSANLTANGNWYLRAAVRKLSTSLLDIFRGFLISEEDNYLHANQILT